MPEDAQKDGHIRGRSKRFIKHPGYREGLGIRFFQANWGEKFLISSTTEALTLRNNLTYKHLHLK
jgi:hypothetical protein